MAKNNFEKLFGVKAGTQKAAKKGARKAAAKNAKLGGVTGAAGAYYKGYDKAAKKYNK